MSETKQTRKFCRTLEAQGAMTYPLVGSQYAPPGWPDRLVVHAEKWTGMLEFKAFEGKLKPRQQHIIQQLKLRGMQVHVARFSESEKLLRLEDEGGNVETDWFPWGKFFQHVAS